MLNRNRNNSFSQKKGTRVSKSHALANMHLFLLVSHRKRWRIYCGFVCTVASACSNAPFFAQVTAAFGDCQPRPPIPQLWKKLFPNLLREFAFWHPKLLSANNALLFWTSQNGKKGPTLICFAKKVWQAEFFISIPTLHPFVNSKVRTDIPYLVNSYRYIFELKKCYPGQKKNFFSRKK